MRKVAKRSQGMRTGDIHCRSTIYRRLLGVCCALLFCSIAGVGRVSAATANTIRGQYGLQLAQDIVPLKEELLKVQRTIRTVQEVSIYNSIIESTSTEEIDKEITDLTSEAGRLREAVLGGIDLPLEDLLQYEAEYKETVTNLDTLLRTRDYYIVDPLPVPDEDLAALLSTESSLQSTIKDAGYYEDIGSLTYYPVKGQIYKVNSPFGPRYDPVGIRGYSYHSGVDLKAPHGTPVGAWFAGTVVATGYSYGSGNYVWLDHGYGVKSFYCHLSRVDVVKGQHVTQGTQIAASGNTGRYTTGPHLHLGLYIDGTAVDPRVILG